MAYRGLFGTGVGIVREEGVLALWRGITPALYRHLVYSGSRMVLYEQFRDSIGNPDSSKAVLWVKTFARFLTETTNNLQT